ncbi:hypothetical protein GOBAR_DD11766 [Gossypium barbadense]|nr:hypothetical protein GOBAR_DD11766 [Gossypium barbadense]
MDNPSPVELFEEIAKPDPIQVSHRDPNDDFSDPDLDDIPKDINEEGPVEGENVNSHLAGNTGPDPDAALAREFSKYSNIVPAYLLDEEFDGEELFEYVLGTVTDLQTLSYKGPDEEIQLGKQVFHQYFWMFEPCVRAFPHWHQLVGTSQSPSGKWPLNGQHYQARPAQT